MPKNINIIGRSNGVGLDSDVLLITQALKDAGHNVTFSHCRSRNLIHKYFYKKQVYDINIFLERIFPVWYGSAKKNILIPNQERFPERHLSRLKHIQSIFCKSRHALDIFSKHTDSAQFVGFTSKDILINEITPNYNQFFHLAGSSTLKGTKAILNLWKKHPEWPELTILQHEHNAPDRVPKNVTLITERLPQDKLVTIANQKGIHLCTSLSEGWGHYIVEAMSSKALVITTDAPPMNELINNDRGILVPFTRSAPRHLGTNFYIDENKLEAEIQKAILMSPHDKSTSGQNARDWFIQNDIQFKENLITAINSVS